jgi:catechol 2,3-dioxygenase-like lactoylglutathione lyase family enzyme
MNRFGYVIVFVSDMDRSVAFYRDALGFLIRRQFHKWMELDTGGTTIALGESSRAAARSRDAVRR